MSTSHERWIVYTPEGEPFSAPRSDPAVAWISAWNMANTEVRELKAQGYAVRRVRIEQIDDDPAGEHPYGVGCGR